MVLFRMLRLPDTAANAQLSNAARALKVLASTKEVRRLKARC